MILTNITHKPSWFLFVEHFHSLASVLSANSCQDVFLAGLPFHARNEKRLMAVLIPWYNHKMEPKMSLTLKNDFISAVTLLCLPLSWTQAQFYLTTLIKTRTSVQSRRRWDEIVFNRITS